MESTKASRLTLSEWFVQRVYITLALLCRPLLSPPRVEFNFSIRTKRNRHNSVRSAYHSQTTLRKVLPFPFRHCFDRHRASSSYCYSTETTNAANYTTTRAANRTSTTRLLLTIIYYFFTLPPPVWNVSRTIVTFIIDPALSGKKRVCNVSTSVSKPTCHFAVINVFILAIDRERKRESFGKSKQGRNRFASFNGVLSIRIMKGCIYIYTFSNDNNRDRKLKI